MTHVQPAAGVGVGTPNKPGGVHPQTVTRKVVSISSVVVTGTVGKAFVTFADGSTSEDPFPYLDSYVPTAGDVAFLDRVAGSPLLIGAASSNRGLPDVQTGTSTAGPTSGTTELTIISSASITLDGRTRVKVVFSSGNMHPTVVNDVFTFRISMDGVSQREIRFLVTTAAADSGRHYEWVSGTAPSAGAHVFSARVVRASGTGVMSVDASATVMYQLTVAEFQ